MTEGYHHLHQEQAGRGGFVVPEVDLTEPLSPADFTDFLRDIWRKNDPGMPPFPDKAQGYKYRHVPLRNQVSPADMRVNQPPVIFTYAATPEVGSNVPAETFKVLLPPITVNPLSVLIKATYAHNAATYASAQDHLDITYRGEEKRLLVPAPGEALPNPRPAEWLQLSLLAHYLVGLTQRVLPEDPGVAGAAD
jgi:hypothetical protein